MPKITIREEDLTSQTTITQNILTVVVPGFVGNGDGDGFDENDIYECASQEDFVKHVGRRAGVPYTVSGAYATALSNGNTPVADKYDSIDNYKVHIASAVEFKNYSAKGNIYEVADGTAEDPKTFVNTLRLDEATVVESETHTPSYMYYVLTEVKDLTAFDETKNYVIVAAGCNGNEPSDTAEAEYNVQMGNQIAYELLGMGYTVLYKKITDYTDLQNDETFTALKDRANYDFRFIVSGCKSDTSTIASALTKVCIAANKDITNVDGRGDCAAILSVPEDKYAGKTGKELYKAIADNSKLNNPYDLAGTYAMWVAPGVCLDLSTVSADVLKDYNNNDSFPASFYYLACFAYSYSSGYSEWYATAGYTRGVCKYPVISTVAKLGETAINYLEPRAKNDDTDHAVNVIAKVKNNYYLWGNRTAATLSDELQASHFMNIRNLCTTLKKQIYIACRKFTFDPNSDTLWVNFVNAIKPTLERMKADQGIEDYKIVQIRTTKKATLMARVRIIPIEAVEDFDITVSLENSFGTTTATVSE